MNTQFSQRSTLMSGRGKTIRLAAGIIGLTGLVTLLGISYAQSPMFREKPLTTPSRNVSEEHLSTVRSIFEELTNPQRSGSCIVDFTTTVVSRLYAKLDTSVTSVHYAGNPHRLLYESDRMSFYQDDSVAVAIIPERKNLFITRSSKEAVHDRQAGLFARLQDSLFERCDVLEDHGLDGDGASRRMVLAPDARMRNFYAIDRVTIEFNSEKKTLRNIRVDFVHSNEVASTEMRYDRIEWGSEPAELRKPIIGRFFASDAKTPLAGYKGYTIIDKRQ